MGIEVIHDRHISVILEHRVAHPMELPVLQAKAIPVIYRRDLQHLTNSVGHGQKLVMACPISRHPPDDGLVEAEIAAFDRFWQCQFLGAGLSCTQASDLPAALRSNSCDPLAPQKPTRQSDAPRPSRSNRSGGKRSVALSTCYLLPFTQSPDDKPC